ncbi:MAG: hypothetical protein QW039_05930 [Fervidicoccaceae archaeon]
MGSLKEIEFNVHSLEEFIDKYSPSMLHLIECSHPTEEELSFMRGIAEEKSIDLGIAAPASLNDFSFVENYVEYFVLYLKGEAERNASFLSHFKGRTLEDLPMIEVHIGVNSREELTNTLKLYLNISSIPIHIFVLKPIGVSSFISSKNLNIYIHDFWFGSSDSASTRCLSCGFPLISFKNFFSSVSQFSDSTKCPRCQKKVFLREPDKKWVNKNLLMKGIELLRREEQEWQ